MAWRRTGSLVGPSLAKTISVAVLPISIVASTAITARWTQLCVIQRFTTSSLARGWQPRGFSCSAANYDRMTKQVEIIAGT